MSKCYCGFALAVLVIVFAWLPVSWAHIALTVLGILLAGKALVGTCCCKQKEKPDESETPAETA